MRASRVARGLGLLILAWAGCAYAGRNLLVMPDPPIINFLNFPDPNTCSMGLPGNPIMVIVLNNPSSVAQNVASKVNFTKATGCPLKSSSLVAGVGGVTPGFSNLACTAVGTAGAVRCDIPSVAIPPASSVMINVVPTGVFCGITDVVLLGTTMEISIAENSGFLLGTVHLQCPALTIQTPFVTRINQGKPF